MDYLALLWRQARPRTLAEATELGASNHRRIHQGLRGQPVEPEWAPPLDEPIPDVGGPLRVLEERTTSPQGRHLQRWSDGIIRERK